MSTLFPVGRTLRVLAALREADPSGALMFGANAHRYRLYPPLDAQLVAVFERTHRIKLPDGYREFLTLVGNGGAGPFYGVFSLGEMDDSYGTKPWRPGEFVGSLGTPFPHREAWNAPQHELDAIRDCEDDEQHEALVSAYWGDAVGTVGAIPICHRGCAMRDWLVVSGPEAGRVWNDDRVDYAGWRPLLDADDSHLTFERWYGQWIDLALIRLGMHHPASARELGLVAESTPDPTEF